MHAATPEQAHQFGERTIALDRALSRGLAAAAELHLDVVLTPLLEDAASTWRCELRRDGVVVLDGIGLGKGTTAEAKVGALFEALEHRLSGASTLSEHDIVLRSAHEVAAQRHLIRDAAVALLVDGPDDPIACFTYRSALDGSEVAVPVALSVPQYLRMNAEELRYLVGDPYRYNWLRRYSMNNGWAAGSDPTEALVHGLNETVERDAMSLLLARTFLKSPPARLTAVDPATLPEDLALLWERAKALTGGEVRLIDMTTDLGVPAYWAFLPPPAGQPARVRGCGASLSRRYALNRAITELIQIHTTMAGDDDDTPPRRDRTTGYPALHRCRLADFTEALRTARFTPFEDAPAPGSPREHAERLITTLHRSGFAVHIRNHHTTANLAVVNVFVPGLERFTLVTDGALVLPGPRGLAAARTETADQAVATPV
ncbi:YcaO-like family protein [Saccharothrix obliqua]|uniref:YcaO-like family protein n=1 Tax=Saccharothrix obliqua TaxID=2861747 RepID=UPI001C5F8E98|nr:YcaO-like family protein [Saccharothrix obliqua]MBW4718155.1 YcaO-like family protein [Saccharothrix obliqua]